MKDNTKNQSVIKRNVKKYILKSFLTIKTIYLKKKAKIEVGN